MDFYSLFELAQIKAIHSAIEPSMDSIWRLRCREYSEKFHTPLHVVINELEPMFVLQQLYESDFPPSILDDELEDLLEKLYQIKDPSYTKMSKEELEELVDNVLNREIARSKKNKKDITQETIIADVQKEEIKKQKSGSMNFKELEKLDSQQESSLSGFKD